MSKLKFKRGGIGAIIAWTLVVVLILHPVAGAVAQIKGGCEENINEAEKKFYDGFFDDAINILNQCLAEKDITIQQKARVHELLAKTYLGKDYLDQAENTIRKLLELVPTYTANPERDTPTFIELVQKVKSEGKKEEVEKKAWYKNTWVWIAAGGVVVAVIAVVIISSGNEEDKKETPQSYWD